MKNERAGKPREGRKGAGRPGQATPHPLYQEEHKSPARPRPARTHLCVEEQSASLPGSVDLVSTLLRRTCSGQ